MMLLWFNWVTFAFVVLIQLIGIVAGIHALLNKADPRAALGWTAICIGVPAIGVVLYLLFGVNRVSVVAKHWESRGRWRIDQHQYTLSAEKATQLGQQEKLKILAPLNKTADIVCDYPLLKQNSIQVLYDGAQAYPAMLSAMDEAKETLFLSTYIFSSRAVGQSFIDALVAARRRGVDVKVLIDGIGAFYNFPSAYRTLKRHGVQVSLFLHPFKIWYHTLHLNLRNHRKSLIVDGRVAFAGGMNIRKHHAAVGTALIPKIRDIHFKMKGAIVGQLQDVFLKDWYFNTKQSPENVVYFNNTPQGEAMIRAIASGPQQSYAQLQSMLLAALSCAKTSIRIMTPYFVPDQSVISALNTAALRGLKIDIILPKKNNVFYIKGASEAILPELIKQGVSFYYRLGEFSHIKLFLVDERCAFIGSSNIDNRSLRLNFELDFEVYDQALCQELNHYFEEVKLTSMRITNKMLQSRLFIVKLRNAFYKLFSPYL